MAISHQSQGKQNMFRRRLHTNPIFQEANTGNLLRELRAAENE
jgi:hypothetical protein